jgi:hypothetical protein
LLEFGTSEIASNQPDTTQEFNGVVTARLSLAGHDLLLLDDGTGRTLQQDLMLPTRYPEGSRLHPVLEAQGPERGKLRMLALVLVMEHFEFAAAFTSRPKCVQVHESKEVMTNTAHA